MPDQSQISAISQITEIVGSQVAASSLAVVPEIVTSAVGLSSVSVIMEIGPELPRSIVPDISGSPGTVATFNGGASVTDTFNWEWVSIPAESGIVNLPDNASGSLMADNEVLFHFDGNTTDSSGNNKSLTLAGNPFAPDPYGRATGSLGYSSGSSVAILDSPVSLAGGNWTIAFWFYNLIPQGNYRSAVRGTSNIDVQIIIENNSERLGTFIHAGGNPRFRPSGFSMPSASYQGWHHIAAVGSGTTTQFYVDGVYVGVSDRKSVHDVHSIGNYESPTSGGLQQRFAERLDEFAIWSRALSAPEIREVYNLGVAGARPVTPLPDNGVGSLMADNVALFHFDSNGNDSSGNGINLTLSNSPSFVGGYVGNSIDLNGTNQTASTTDSRVKLTGDMSLFTWIFLDDLTDNDNLIRCGGAGEAPANNLLYFIQLEGTSGDILYIHEYGPGNNQSVVVSGMVSAGQWLHIGFVRDATAKTVKFYRDGRVIQTFSYTDNADGGSTSPLFLGSNGAGDRFMNGRFDEFAIWSRALSSSDVAQIYDSQSGQPLDTVSFTPDVVGTYSVSLATTKNGYSESATASANITGGSASTGIGNMAGASLYSRSLSGTHFLIPFTGIDPSEDLD